MNLAQDDTPASQQDDAAACTPLRCILLYKWIAVGDSHEGQVLHQ